MEKYTLSRREVVQGFRSEKKRGISYLHSQSKGAEIVALPNSGFLWLVIQRAVREGFAFFTLRNQAFPEKIRYEIIDTKTEDI